MWRRFMGRAGAGAVAAGLLAVLLAAAPGVAQGDDGLPEAMQRLEAFVGSWETDRVEFLDEAGGVERVSAAEAHNEQLLGGLVLAHSGRLADPEIHTRGWYYWHQEDQRLHMGSVSSSGRYDEFVGGWEGDRLVMVTLPNPAYGGRTFRMTHSDITDDSYVETMAVSTDGGETWRLSHRQVMRRVGSTAAAGRPAALDALGAYTGHWRSDEKTDREGNTFHFEYDLKWLDPDRTISKLRITQILPEATSVVFEGYKRLDPSGGVEYVGASPSGRGARGEVVMEGADLVTIYDGWTAGGNVVKIRDVFEPVEDGAFISRTYLRPEPGADWRQIGRDEWRKVGPPR